MTKALSVFDNLSTHNKKLSERSFIGGPDWKTKKLTKSERSINEGIVRARKDVARTKKKK
jgi:hypothetical protein